MSRSATEQAREFYAQTYDVSVSDWPGEIGFYRELAAKAQTKSQAVLELACGTGRVAIPLAQAGAEVLGLDHCPAMLEVAREKSVGISNMRWVQGDMRSFELNETFGLIIIPGHAFQNIVTAADQTACLESIKRHLAPRGVLVVHLDHQNLSWLGGLTKDEGGVFKAAEQFLHPQTGRQVRTMRAWSYEPSTQTAIVQTIGEEIEADGRVVGRWETGAIRLHCLFRFEMEHLLARVGFSVDDLYGNFFRQELQDKSSEMLWVARSRDHSLPPVQSIKKVPAAQTSRGQTARSK